MMPVLTIRTAEDLTAARLADLRARMAAAVAAHVEDHARTLGYESGAVCASYAVSSVAEWAAEASAFVSWRDAVWQKAISVMDGQSEIETTEDLLAALPTP